MRTYTSEDIVKTREWIDKQFKKAGQLYDDKPYIYHLNMVFDRFIYLASYTKLTNDEIQVGKIAALLHDTIEDLDFTYNDMKKKFCVRVADLVYALTNEKGKNRNERANLKYYKGIQSNVIATLVKLVDRLANFEHSNSGNGSKRHGSMYHKEMKKFVSCLYNPEIKGAFHVFCEKVGMSESDQRECIMNSAYIQQPNVVSRVNGISLVTSLLNFGVMSTILYMTIFDFGNLLGSPLYPLCTLFVAAIFNVAVYWSSVEVEMSKVGIKT